MAKHKFMLDPNETAMENLWRAATYASKYILQHKRLRLSKDKWNELLEILTINTVYFFIKHKVKLHKYCHKVDFFCNVFSACRSVSGTKACIDRYLNTIKRRITDVSTSVTNDYSEELEASLVDTGVHPLWHRIYSRIHYESVIKRNETAEDALNRIWADEDERLHADGRYHDYNAIKQHRDEVLQRIKEAKHDSNP